MEKIDEQILEILKEILKSSSIEYKEIQVNNNKNSITYIAFKSILLRVLFRKVITVIEIKNIDNLDIEKIKSKFKDVVYKPKNPYIKIHINQPEEIALLKEEILKVFEYLHDNEQIETFGCCSRYTICSDEKRCVHPDNEFARGCIYKSNLDSGKIFYGKNKNV